jgi:hypothetical protein
MTDNEERAYEQGVRAGLRRTLQQTLQQLGYELADDLEQKVAGLVLEREETIAMLRTVCEEFGDNDWDDRLHLADVIEKHLARNLRAEKHDSPHQRPESR